jgi:hypothetical protein
MKGFPIEFIKWIKYVVSGGNVCVMVNDKLGPYFRNKKGLRQGDPASPILFTIAADVLAVLVQSAQDKGCLQDVGGDLLDDGVAHIQYADDTIFLLEDDLEGSGVFAPDTRWTLYLDHQYACVDRPSCQN